MRERSYSCHSRLNRLLKNLLSAGFVSGHDFNRADELLVFVIPSGLQPARDLLFRLFQQPVKPLPTEVYSGPACAAPSLTLSCNLSSKAPATMTLKNTRLGSYPCWYGFHHLPRIPEVFIFVPYPHSVALASRLVECGEGHAHDQIDSLGAWLPSDGRGPCLAG